MSEKFLMIDGSSLIFRAFFAIRNLTTKDGIHTNAVYGFLNMYKRALEILEPDYVVVAFDRAGPTFRNKDYEEYKGTRDKTPPELSHQFAMLKDILEAMNVVHLDMDEYEADDIIGTLSRIAGEKDIQSYMLTGDRDYFQLVSEKAKVLYTVKGISELETYDIDKVRQRYDLNPIDLIEIKGLMGDQSDNIPGVPGVGEKTAIKLIKEYGNIEKIYENIDKISGKKLKENLIDNEQIAYLSRKLGRIFTEVPIEYELEDFKKKEADADLLYEKFKKLEFNSFMNMFKSDKKEHLEDKDFDIEGIDSLDKAIEAIKKSKKLYFEIFSNDDNYINSDISYLGLTAGSDKLWVLDFSENKDEIISKIKEIFEDEKIEKVSFDIKKAIFLLDKYGINFEKGYIDLLVLAYLIDPSRSSYDMDDISSHYLDRDILSQEEFLGKGKSKKIFEELEDKVRDNYIGAYLLAIRDSKDKLLQEIKELRMDQLYYDIELPLINILARMEIAGVKINRAELEKIDKELCLEIDQLEDTIHELAGSEFNINSPKQIGEILFEKLHLPVIKRTKTGYSTDAEVLDKLKGSHEIIEHIQRYREIKKLKSTYIDGLYPYIMDDSRIRTIFRQTITATGRLSSVEPNLQNIPTRTEEGRLIRKAFIADENCKLIAADYSQIELRILAALSKDEKMLDAFKHGIDIHKKTASEVFDVKIDEVSSQQRYEAKAVNFGIIYGISDYGLSQDLNITRKQAKNYIDNYLESYPNIGSYMKSIVETAKKQAYVETIFNRRRYVPEINSKNFNIRSFGERIALNTPIQGSAADIIKVAMVKVYNRLKKEGLKSNIILQIHDELIIEAKEDEIKIVERILKEEMEDAVKLDVDLVADVELGDSWYEV